MREAASVSQRAAGARARACGYAREPCREAPLAIAFFAQDFPPRVGGTHVYNHGARAAAARTRAPRARLHLDDGRARRARPPTPRSRSRSIASRSRGPAAASRRPASPRRCCAGGPTSRSCRAARARCRGSFTPPRRGCRASSRCTICATRGGAAGVSGAGACAGATASIARRALTANSEHTRRRLLELGVAAAKVAIVYPGVDTQTFLPGPAGGRAGAQGARARGRARAAHRLAAGAEQGTPARARGAAVAAPALSRRSST